MKSTDNNTIKLEKGYTYFSQQYIKAWRPLVTPPLFFALLYLFGFIFLIIGTATMLILPNLPYYEIRYDDICNIGESCQVTFDVDQDMEGTLFIHYKLTNFYQNHQKYIYSVSYGQIIGNFLTYEDLKDSCEGYTNNSDNKIYVPCGAVALSFYNDTISADRDSDNQEFQPNDIAWPGDTQFIFRKISDEYNDENSEKWLSPPSYNNEVFMSWLKLSPFSTLYKPYLRCSSCRISKGTQFKVEIENNYDTSSFGGEKYVILSKVTYMGARSRYIGIYYLTVAIFLLTLAVIITILHNTIPRSMGDTTVLMKKDSRVVVVNDS